MGWINTKRKNNKWNIWSTIVDAFLLDKDVPLEKLESFYTELQIKRLKENIRQDFDKIKKGKGEGYLFRLEKDLP